MSMLECVSTEKGVGCSVKGSVPTLYLWFCIILHNIFKSQSERDMINAFRRIR